MKIYCKKCGKLLGEIKDAKLYKGGREIIYLHKKCYYTPREPPKYDLPEWAKESLFGGFKK